MILVSNHPSSKVFFFNRLRHFIMVTTITKNFLIFYSFPTFGFSRGYSLQQSTMILRVSELQTGWLFVTPITIDCYRNFEVIEKAIFAKTKNCRRLCVADSSM